MKLVLSKENQEKILNHIKGAKITNGHTFVGDSKRTIYWTGVIQDLFLDKEEKKFKVAILIGNHTSSMSLKELFVQIHKNSSYRTTSKNLRDISSLYYKCAINNNNQEFINYVERLGDSDIEIEDTEILDEEVKWLNAHVTSIKAVFPKKYLKCFLKNFPNSEYTLREKSWTYGFSMHFNNLKDIPESLLTLKNSEGNTLDTEKNVMNNTSYIWHLVKENPDKFAFGKRNLKGVK